MTRGTGALRILLSSTLLLGACPARAAQPNPLLKTIDYDGKGILRDTFGDLQITVDAIGPPDVRGPRLRVGMGGKPAFKLQLAGEGGNASATVRIVRLGGAGVGGAGPEAAPPQVLFQHFTFGAHCCVVTKIATQVDGHWKAVLGDTLDGDAGYDIVDIDGIAVLVGADQSFLYAFAGYASSLAPIKIQELQGAALVDVTREPRFRAAVVASLSSIEPKKRDDDQWHSNGFLGAWVATKAMLGEGPAAWAKMLKVYDAESDWSMQLCDNAVKTDCPANRLRSVTFPEALRQHLLIRGYVSDVADYPLPSAKPIK